MQTPNLTPLIAVSEGGFSNFLSIYNVIITARILLSWFPQAQGIGVLQPVFTLTDPYLNLFRGVICIIMHHEIVKIEIECEGSVIPVPTGKMSCLEGSHRSGHPGGKD